MELERLGTFVTIEEYEFFTQKYGESLASGKIRDAFAKDPAFLKFYRNLYLEVMKYTDEIVADFVSRYLEHRPNTLFVITSDHGEFLLERPQELMHGDSTVPYDWITRVPLLLYWPGNIEGGRRVETPVQHVDLLPTLAELISVAEIPDRLDGTSFADVVRGGQGNTNLTNHFCMVEGGYGNCSYSVLKDGYKFINLSPASEDGLNQIHRTGKSQMLFDLDGEEDEDLLTSLPGKAAACRNFAHSVLIGRDGYHLVYIGDGEIKRIEGRFLAKETIGRCTIRYHHPSFPIDMNLVHSPEFNLLLRPGRMNIYGQDRNRFTSGLPKITLDPNETLKMQVRPITVKGVKPGRRLTLNVGFRLPAIEPSGDLRVEYDYRRKNFSDTVKPLPETELWFFREYASMAASSCSVVLKNQSDKPITLDDAFISLTEVMERAYKIDDESLAFQFALADGLADLNWQYNNHPSQLMFDNSMEDSPPIFIWKNGRFLDSKQKFSLTSEGLQSLEVADPYLLADVLEQSLAKGRKGLYFYRVGPPFNKDKSKGKDKDDDETRKNLEALGYL